MIDNLIKQTRENLSQIPDYRKYNKTYGQIDSLMGAFAMFSLKDPSLLAFRKEFPARADNLKRIYGITTIPADTAMREAIDKIPPKELSKQFVMLQPTIREQKIFDTRKVLGGYLIATLDATGTYCSCKTSCESCLVKTLKNGENQYYHQMLAVVNVHPNQKTVFPLDAEAIIQQDGNTKNDCELNASKRLIPSLRASMPEDKLLVVADALYANSPFIRLVQGQGMNFITVVKQGYALLQAERLEEKGKLTTKQWLKKDRICKASFATNLIFNGENQDLLVNYVQYTEIDAKTGKIYYNGKWLTDLPISKHYLKEFVRVARSRWKIENETFNTLKNQNYHLEHNYGHGEKYLATNFALLTILAFLVDQITQHLDSYFKQVWDFFGSKKLTWQKIREVFNQFPCASMNAIYRFLVKELTINLPLLE
jgi:hypothetical protein